VILLPISRAICSDLTVDRDNINEGFDFPLLH
jgi:hypothetical protein